jgi:hypothetical protein
MIADAVEILPDLEAAHLDATVIFILIQLGAAQVSLLRVAMSCLQRADILERRWQRSTPNPDGIRNREAEN